jgi:hypothetical protein
MKFVPQYARKTKSGLDKGIALPFLYPWLYSGMGDQRHAPAALPPLYRHGNNFPSGWVGLGAGLKGYGKFVLTTIRNPDRQVRSQPLHRIS